METPMKAIHRWIEKLSGLMNAVASLAILALMIMTAADILSRKFTGASIVGVVELSEFLMVILVYSALAQCEMMNRNVKVDLFSDLMGIRLRTITGMISSFTGFLLFALIAAASVSYAVSIEAVGEVSMDLQIARYPFVLLTAAGCAVLSLVCFSNLFSSRKDPY
jgi:TRAP-type transport system small permease protein